MSFDELETPTDNHLTSPLEGPKETPHPITVAEAGRRGGRTTRDRYGPDHFARLGKKGGAALKTQQGLAFYQRIGHQGGQATKDKYEGSGHFRQIGRKGGNALKAQRDASYFRTIGTLGGMASQASSKRKKSTRAQSRDQEREETLRAVFEQLNRDTPPPTPPALAKLTGWSLSLVYRVLGQASWWGVEQHQAARAAHYQRLHEQAAARGYPGIQAMRQHPPSTHRRRLTLEEVREIRRQLEQGEKPTRIARAMGTHQNTIYSLKKGRVVRVETQTADLDQGGLLIRVVLSRDLSTVRVFLSWALFRLLGRPALLRIARQGKGHALALETGRQIDWDYPVMNAQGNHIPFIQGDRQLLETLGLAAGSYMAAPVPDQRAKARLSDYPREQAAAMITLSDACALLGITRQGLSSLIAKGHFRSWYDAERKQLVVLRDAILARQAQRAGTDPGKAGPRVRPGTVCELGKQRI